MKRKENISTGVDKPLSRIEKVTKYALGLYGAGLLGVSGFFAYYLLKTYQTLNPNDISIMLTNLLGHALIGFGSICAARVYRETN